MADSSHLWFPASATASTIAAAGRDGFFPRELVGLASQLDAQALQAYLAHRDRRPAQDIIVAQSSQLVSCLNAEREYHRTVNYLNSSKLPSNKRSRAQVLEVVAELEKSAADACLKLRTALGPPPVPSYRKIDVFEVGLPSSHAPDGIEGLRLAVLDCLVADNLLGHSSTSDLLLAADLVDRYAQNATPIGHPAQYGQLSTTFLDSSGQPKDAITLVFDALHTLETAYGPSEVILNASLKQREEQKRQESLSEAFSHLSALPSCVKDKTLTPSLRAQSVLPSAQSLQMLRQAGLNEHSVSTKKAFWTPPRTPGRSR